MLPLVLVNVDPGFAVERPISHTAAIGAERRPEGLVCLAWGDTVLPGASSPGSGPDAGHAM
jgi:hypothetical protein